MSAPLHLRSWCGWRRSDAGDWARFAGDIATTFVPATWQVMHRHGLLSYVPGLLREDHAAALPDEVALLIYRSEDEYNTQKNTVAGRGYGLMHGAVFDFAKAPGNNSDKTSGTNVPTPWPGGDGGTRPRKAWHRSTAGDGASLLSPYARVQFIAVELASGATPTATPQALFDALAPTVNEAAVLIAPAFALAWVALDAKTDAAAIAAAFTAASGGTLAAAQVARDATVTAGHTDVYVGTDMRADESLRFLDATDAPA